MIQYSLCSAANDGDCTNGEGPKTVFDSGLDEETVKVSLKVKTVPTNLNLASLTEKSNALFKKLNLSSDADDSDSDSDDEDSDLPEDASAQYYAGLLYAYTYQEVDERDYIVECSKQRDELDQKLVSAYNSYKDE